MVNIGYFKFSVDGGLYVYDTTTNSLLEIDERVYRALSDYDLIDVETLRMSIGKGSLDEKLNSTAKFNRPPRGGQDILQPFFQKEYSTYLDLKFIDSHLKRNMRRLMLNVTDQCNQRCKYCFFSGDYFSCRTHSDKHMTWKVAKASIDYFLGRIEKTKRPMIGFYGGEPLLNWHLIEKCVEYIGKKGKARSPSVAIISNGTLLTERIIDCLIENDVAISISLDGPAEVHDAARVYRNGKGTHRKVIESLATIQRKSPDYLRKRVSISCTYDRSNDVVELFRYFSDDPLCQVLVRLRPIRDFDTDSHTLPEETEKKFHQDLGTLINVYFEYLQKGLNFNYSFIQNVFYRIFHVLPQRDIGLANRDSRPNKTCIPGVSQLFVSTDGIFYACDNFCPPAYYIGDYKAGIEIAKVQRLLEAYVQMCEDMCQNCCAYRLCSLCFVHTLENGHMSKNRKEVSCFREKQRISNDLRRYVYILKNEPATSLDHGFTLNALVQKELSRKKREDSNTFPGVKLKKLPSSVGVTRHEIESALSDIG